MSASFSSLFDKDMAKSRLSGAFLLLSVLGLILALSGAPALAHNHHPVVVSSKADTEGALLGNMIALTLEREGIPVQARLQLGPTLEVRTAILKGEIDIYPEYTGNGAFFHGLESDPAWKAPASAYKAVKRLDAERHKLTWLERAPANNTWLIAVRGDLARRSNLTSMDDFAQAVRGSMNLRLAASAEFVESPAALPSFEKTYEFHFPRDRIVVQPSGNTMTTIRAAAQNIGGVNAAMVYGTDGAIATLDLVVMKDTRGAQIVYEPAPVVRAEVLERFPRITKALAPVFSSLSTAKLQALNAEIVINERPAREVAERYLNELHRPPGG
jgi:osmoprotectant transport system substrate-binding protein